MPWEWRLKNSFPRGSGGGGGGGCEGTDERAYGGSGGVDDNWSDCDISDGACDASDGERHHDGGVMSVMIMMVVRLVVVVVV